MILVSRSSPSHDLFSFPKFVIFILAWVYHNGRRKTIAYLKRLHILQWHMQNVQYHMQNTQYPMQNMQYQTKLSPSYPQSYPQKGVTNCKMCSTPTAKHAVPTVKYAVPHAKYAVQNKVIPKLSPKLSPKRCYTMQNMQYPIQNTQYPMQNMQYPL